MLAWDRQQLSQLFLFQLQLLCVGAKHPKAYDHEPDLDWWPVTKLLNGVANKF